MRLVESRKDARILNIFDCVAVLIASVVIGSHFDSAWVSGSVFLIAMIVRRGHFEGRED